TPTEFAEEPAATVEPFSESPFPDGIHTLSGVGDLTLIDSNQHRFFPRAIPYVLRNRPVPGRDRAMSHRTDRLYPSDDRPRTRQPRRDLRIQAPLARGPCTPDIYCRV